MTAMKIKQRYHYKNYGYYLDIQTDKQVELIKQMLMQSKDFIGMASKHLEGFLYISGMLLVAYMLQAL